MNKAKWENWTNLALGVWLFISPLIIANKLPTDVAMRTEGNFYIVGAVIAIAAALAIRDLQPWEEWVNLALGAWMFISPWVFGYSSETNLMWNSLIVGAVVAALSGITIPIALKLSQQK